MTKFKVHPDNGSLHEQEYIAELESDLDLTIDKLYDCQQKRTVDLTLSFITGVLVGGIFIFAITGIVGVV